ncbi:unnamed protein product [Haemonchus placei]|uniref:Secreted protein n=1 Tax=Haemonchus placei TaxID=6290 RepID=A0A0N4WBJ6_HAEPC|nr:unnamed protein product [Haemonchus placei]
MKGNGESHLRLLLGPLRQPRLPAYPPSWAIQIYRSSGSPFRNPTSHNVAKNCTAPCPDRIKPYIQRICHHLKSEIRPSS